jgi:dihydrofolate reductase
MGKIIAVEGVSLDGVMQAPARPDEDTRGGFRYGGWGIPYSDPDMVRIAFESTPHAGALLLGRLTYENFFSVWPKRSDNPFTDGLNNTLKYVASTTLKEPLPWMNSILLKGDVPKAVAALKAQLDKDVVVLGSGVLVQSLEEHHLVDRYVLQIAPLVLGTGKRLFKDGGSLAAFRLVDTKTTSKGVVIAIYERAEPMAGAGRSV